jgi:hypothetical protein
MVGEHSSWDQGHAENGVSWRERRALARARRALQKGTRVTGRPLAEGRHGLLVDLRGVVGHVPASEAGRTPERAAGLRSRLASWEGWVCAVGDDLVHLSTNGPTPAGDDGEICSGIITAIGPTAAVVRLDGRPDDAILPWEEMSWEPALGDPRLETGDRVAGRVVAITLEGPVLSPRSVLPTPWPAVALALPAGSRIAVRIERLAGGRAEVRTCTPPRVRSIVGAGALPGDAAPGDVLETTVVRVDPIGGALVLDELAVEYD